MAKAFTASGKEQIRRQLLRRGRDYFSRYGLKKTSVEELARAAGIAKGSFYTFFESKEALFLAVHEESEARLRRELIGQLEKLDQPAEKLRFFLKSSFRMLEEDPLMASVFGGGGLDGFSGFLASGEYEQHYRQNIGFMNGLISQWQAEGIIKPVDAEVAGNLIASSFFLFLQKETLGDDMYDKVTDMLIESLVDYLSVEA